MAAGHSHQRGHDADRDAGDQPQPNNLGAGNLAGRHRPDRLRLLREPAERVDDDLLRPRRAVRRLRLEAGPGTRKPRPLTDKWPALARFLTRPQLFLEDHYTLHRFLGQTARGEPLDTIGLAARAKRESKIVTKINTTRATESQRNILESTCQQAVDEVADRTGADSSSTGSTQNVRQGFADSLRNELSSSSSRTMETNKEVTSIESVNTQIETSTETELVYTLDNSNNHDEVNFAIVQLTQEPRRASCERCTKRWVCK